MKHICVIFIYLNPEMAENRMAALQKPISFIPRGAVKEQLTLALPH